MLSEEGSTGTVCPDVVAIGDQAQLQREGWSTLRWRVLSRERGHPYMGSGTVEGTRGALRCRTKQMSPIRDWQMLPAQWSGPCCFSATNPSLFWTPTEWKFLSSTLTWKNYLFPHIVLSLDICYPCFPNGIEMSLGASTWCGQSREGLKTAPWAALSFLPPEC